MRRRSFMGLLAGAVFTVLTVKVPVFAAEPLEAEPVESQSMWVYPTMYALSVGYFDREGNEIIFDLAQQGAERTRYLIGAHQAKMGGLGVRDNDWSSPAQRTYVAPARVVFDEERFI